MVLVLLRKQGWECLSVRHMEKTLSNLNAVIVVPLHFGSASVPLTSVNRVIRELVATKLRIVQEEINAN